MNFMNLNLESRIRIKILISLKNKDHSTIFDLFSMKHEKYTSVDRYTSYAFLPMFLRKY